MLIFITLNLIAMEMRQAIENESKFVTLIKYHGFIQICDYVCRDSLVVTDNHNYGLTENSSLFSVTILKIVFLCHEKRLFCV